MNKEFVPQIIAEELKVLGFNQPCLAWWFVGGTVSVPTEGRVFWSDWNVNPMRISAPLWQQVFDWLYDRHGLWTEQFINMHPDTNKIIYSYRLYQIKPDGKAYGKLMVDGFAWTPEELREKIILKAIEKLKNN